MTVEPIRLLPEVKCNSYFVLYSKFSAGNYSIGAAPSRMAGTRGLPASEDITDITYLLTC